MVTFLVASKYGAWDGSNFVEVVSFSHDFSTCVRFSFRFLVSEPSSPFGLSTLSFFTLGVGFGATSGLTTAVSDMRLDFLVGLSNRARCSLRRSRCFRTDSFRNSFAGGMTNGSVDSDSEDALFGLNGFGASEGVG